MNRTRKRGGRPGDTYDDPIVIDDSDPGHVLDYLHGIPAKFHKLIRPMSGVISMCLLQCPTRNILLIGENHSSHECREKGLIPMHDIIIPYLKNTRHVDFMFEMDYEKISLYRQIDSLPEVPFFDEYTLDMKLALTVAKYIPTKRSDANAIHQKRDLQSRIHWLDTLTPKSSAHADVDIMAEHFFRCLGVIVDDENRTEESILGAQRRLFRILASKSTAQTMEAVETVRDTPPGSNYLARIGPAFNTFLKLCISIILESYRFAKCSSIDVNIYMEAFKAAYMSTRTYSSNITVFYDLHRLALDMYAYCRLAKHDHKWYKHIVIRVGEAHTISLRYIFEATGYASRDIDIPLNPDCE